MILPLSMAVPNLTGVLKSKDQEQQQPRDSLSRHISHASRRNLQTGEVIKGETPSSKVNESPFPVMFMEKSHASIGLQGADECEELKVEEEKNDFFDYHFHPVP